jgi:hypothetical protein
LVATEITFHSGTLAIPSTAYNIIVHVDTLKYNNGGPVSHVNIAVNSGSTNYCNNYGLPPLDDTWHTYNFAVDQAAAGQTVLVYLAIWCTNTGTTNAFVYVDNIQFTYDLAMVPGAVPSFTATASAGNVHLSWGTPSDGGSPIIGYTIYKSVDGGSHIWKGDFDDTIHSFDDTDVSDPHSYTYYIYARNAVGNSPVTYSNTAVIPEFHTVLIPIAGLAMCVLASKWRQRGRDGAGSGRATDTPPSP